MSADDDILISVEERHAVNMLAGVKRVELRRKALRIVPGTRVWIYSKLPTGRVRAIGMTQSVVSGTPTEIWARYRDVCAISKIEFDDYFADTTEAYAIVFETIDPVEPILSLKSIRENLGQFQPPQFFKRLTTGSPELSLFETALTVDNQIAHSC